MSLSPDRQSSLSIKRRSEITSAIRQNSFGESSFKSPTPQKSHETEKQELGSKFQRFKQSFFRAPWILNMVFATIAFTFCNVSISHITSYGPTGIFYFSTGTLLSGTVFHLYESFLHYKRKGSLWAPQNLIVKGKLQTANVIAFACFCTIYLLNQILAFSTMYYAYLADLNKGVVSVIWGLNPLFIAFIDFLVYRSRLSPRHYFGFLTLILCTLFIAFSKKIEPELRRLLSFPVEPQNRTYPNIGVRR